MTLGSQVLTIAGAKGGVGKTTTALNLGASIAVEGYSVVAVELDLAMANFVDFLNVDIEETATLHDVLAHGVAVDQAILETESGLDVVPSGLTMGGYVDTDLSTLATVIETLRWLYDIVVLDTPAGLSEETTLPLRLSDSVLLVSSPRVASIRNVRATQEVTDRVDGALEGLVLTRSGTGRSPGADQIADFLELDLLGHVPEDEAVPHSQDHGRPVVTEAPHSGAAIAYRKIARQLVDVESASPDDIDEPMAAAVKNAVESIQEDATDGAENRDDAQPASSASNDHELTEGPDPTTRDAPGHESGQPVPDCAETSAVNRDETDPSSPDTLQAAERRSIEDDDDDLESNEQQCHPDGGIVATQSHSADGSTTTRPSRSMESPGQTTVAGGALDEAATDTNRDDAGGQSGAADDTPSLVARLWRVLR